MAEVQLLSSSLLFLLEFIHEISNALPLNSSTMRDHKLDEIDACSKEASVLILRLALHDNRVDKVLSEYRQDVFRIRRKQVDEYSDDYVSQCLALLGKVSVGDHCVVDRLSA